MIIPAIKIATNTAPLMVLVVKLLIFKTFYY